MLIVFGGLPAVGKTTLAQKVAIIRQATYLRIDTIEHAITREIHPNERHYGAADLSRLTARVVASDNLRLGRFVVVDAFNGREEMRQSWRDVAEACRCRILEVHVVCSDRVEHRRRAEKRQVEHDGREPVKWAAIKDMPFDPWPEASIVIDTARKSVEATADELLLIAPVEKPGWEPR